MTNNRYSLPKNPSLNATPSELHNFHKATNGAHTGRVIVTFDTKRSPDGALEAFIRENFTTKIHSTSQFELRAVSFETLSDAECLVFEHLNIALLGGQAAKDAHKNFAKWQANNSRSHLLSNISIDFERVHHLTGTDLVNSTSPLEPVLPPPISPPKADDITITWGLLVTGVDEIPSGKGIKVAILDTGFTFDHPDFKDRRIIQKSFVPNEDCKDVHGHGTHVAGTACGPLKPKTGNPRYGIAYESEILIGKVLGNDGEGFTGWILAGIEWALEQGAQIINLSLSEKDPTPAEHYNQAGDVALGLGSLIIAAAGNDSDFTGRPANSPSIMAVGAINEESEIADFSNFGKIDITAPGVAINSSLPDPRIRGDMNGTSMACPHVSGIAALYAEQGLRGSALWDRLEKTALDLGHDETLQGAGLVQLSFS